MRSIITLCLSYLFHDFCKFGFLWKSLVYFSFLMNHVRGLHQFSITFKSPETAFIHILCGIPFHWKMKNGDLLHSCRTFFWSLIMHYYITWLWIEFLHIAFNICIFNLGKWEKWLSNHCASIEVHMALIRGNNWTMLFNARSYPVLHFCLIFISRWEEVQNIILVFFEYCSLFTNRCHAVSHNWITNIVNKYLN